MFNGQSAYPQPQWPHGFNQAQRAGPPPMKKPKSNPIITKYPPPPGYRGPAQPQPPYQQAAYAYPQGWSPQGQPFVFGSTPPQTHPPQNYGMPQSWPQPSAMSYPSYPQYPYAQHPQSYYQQPTQPQAYAVPQVPAWQPQASFAPAAPPNPPVHSGHTASLIPQKRRHESVSRVDHAIGPHADRDGSSNTAIESGDNDGPEDSDFYTECYFASHPDEIDESFSLGFITWKAPLLAKRALPNTWAGTELEAIAPRKSLPSDGESISDYLIKSKRHESLLSLRQTSYWEEAKDDFIFRELRSDVDVIPMSELTRTYKDRPDPSWSARPFGATPEPESEAGSDAGDGAIQVDDESKGEDEDANGDVLGNLEQALHRNRSSHSRHHSLANSTASMSSQRLTRPTPLMPIRDQAQEDILAALGVTGTPTVVYQTPGPAVSAHSMKREGSVSASSRHNSITSLNGWSSVNGGPHVPPPPPPPMERRPDYRRTSNESYKSQSSDQRRPSDASQHTAAGSDFGDQEATPRPKYTDRRKRMHESDSDTPDERRRQDNDDTPKQRRKHQRTEDVWNARR